MANPAYYQSSLVSQQVQQKEHLLHLYLYQRGEQPAGGGNQRVIVKPGLPFQFGEAVVIDWSVYDGVPLNAKLVGRAQGSSFAAQSTGFSSWAYGFNIVFTDARFGGSGLKLDGMQGTEKGEWAVVGGTGQFGGAQGTATFAFIKPQPDPTAHVWELHLRFVCTAFTKQTPPIKVEPPVGGNGGQAVDVAAKPQRLLSVTIGHGDVIDSLSFSYVDEAGNNQTAGPWGGKGGVSKTIKLKPTETVNKIIGTTGNFGGHVVVNSLEIVTNLDTYGPYGKGNGTQFAIPQKDNSSVVCFHGRAGLFLDAIGVYAAEN